jgi:hypothetical protein
VCFASPSLLQSLQLWCFRFVAVLRSAPQQEQYAECRYAF